MYMFRGSRERAYAIIFLNKELAHMSRALHGSFLLLFTQEIKIIGGCYSREFIFLFYPLALAVSTNFGGDKVSGSRGSKNRWPRGQTAAALKIARLEARHSPSQHGFSSPRSRSKSEGSGLAVTRPECGKVSPFRFARAPQKGAQASRGDAASTIAPPSSRN